LQKTDSIEKCTGFGLNRYVDVRSLGAHFSSFEPQESFIMVAIHNSLRGFALAGACIAASGAAQAQGSAGYTWSGEVELSYIASLDGSGSAGVLIGDFTLEGTLSGNMGFSIGLEAMGIAGSTSEFNWAPYATLDWRTGNGVLRVGAPRFALDDHLRAPLFGGISAYKRSELGLIGGAASYARLITLLDSSTFSAGVRYDGVSGNLSYSASAHYLFDTTGGDGAGAFQLGATWKQGAVSVFGGIEHITFGSTLASIGAEYDAGQWRLGASINHLGGGGYSTGASAWAGFKPMQNLEVILTGSVVDSSVLYGVGVEYSLNGGYYLRAGLASSSGGFAGTVADIAVGMRF